MTARVLRDCMNHYAIEVLRGSKWVYCIVRLDGQVEHKRYPLKRDIVDHTHTTRDGTYLFDVRWTEDPTYPPEKAAGAFLRGTLPVTPKADRLLRAIIWRTEITEADATQDLDEETVNAEESECTVAE